MSVLRVICVIRFDEQNFSGTVLGNFVYAAIELELGLINANMPFFKPLARKVISRFGLKRNEFDIGPPPITLFGRHLDDDDETIPLTTAFTPTSGHFEAAIPIPMRSEEAAADIGNYQAKKVEIVISDGHQTDT
jgi:hypothetical protein